MTNEMIQIVSDFFDTVNIQYVTNQKLAIRVDGSKGALRVSGAGYNIDEALMNLIRHTFGAYQDHLFSNSQN